ncbi:MAG: hypothetical protein U1A72_17035 [Sulfuritalea sp.]|nr:hypothetical protein [Sulfuritalea sp.]
MTATTTAPIAELRCLSDWQLAFTEKRLVQKIAAMGVPQTRSAALVLQGYVDKLDAVRAEIERRRT